MQRQSSYRLFENAIRKGKERCNRIEVFLFSLSLSFFVNMITDGGIESHVAWWGHIEISSPEKCVRDSCSSPRNLINSYEFLNAYLLCIFSIRFRKVDKFSRLSEQAFWTFIPSKNIFLINKSSFYRITRWKKEEGREFSLHTFATK